MSNIIELPTSDFKMWPEIQALDVRYHPGSTIRISQKTIKAIQKEARIWLPWYSTSNVENFVTFWGINGIPHIVKTIQFLRWRLPEMYGAFQYVRACEDAGLSPNKTCPFRDKWRDQVWYLGYQIALYDTTPIVQLQSGETLSLDKWFAHQVTTEQFISAVIAARKLTK